MALTDKQVRFIDEYMIDMNASAAYLRAGYECNEATARANASRLLTNANILAEIDNRQKKVQEKAGLSVEWLINEFIENHKMAKQLGEVANSNKSLELLGKHLGMFKDKVEITGSISIESMLDSV